MFKRTGFVKRWVFLKGRIFEKVGFFQKDFRKSGFFQKERIFEKVGFSKKLRIVTEVSDEFRRGGQRCVLNSPVQSVYHYFCWVFNSY